MPITKCLLNIIFLKRTIVIADNLSALVQLVGNGSIDAFFSGEQAGIWAIKESGRDQNLLPVVLRVNEQQVWFGLSPDTPKATVMALQEALAKRGLTPSTKNSI